MRRDYVGLWSPAIGAEGGLLAYGHHGRPLLVFQSEQGRCSDYEDRGMIDAVAGLIEAGRVKVYSVDSYDAASWCAADLPLEARAQQHARFEDWILHQVVPFIYDDSQGPLEVMVTGASFGGLFLQSGSFFRPLVDDHERGFPRFRRITRFVDDLAAGTGPAEPASAALTCGTVEENLPGNRVVRDALAARGWQVALHEHRDAHNWVAWRDTFDPWLVGLLQELW